MGRIKLFVNGDSHTASVYPRTPQAKTASEILAERFDLDLENIAMPGGSNQRIARTTEQRLDDLDPRFTIIMIGWSSFERTEWFYQGQWHQICGDAAYAVEPNLRDIWGQHLQAWQQNLYKERFRVMQEQHNLIWRFHRSLYAMGYTLLFYQACQTMFFDSCPEQDLDFRHQWHDGIWVHDPYVRLIDGDRHIESFSHYCLGHGLKHSDDRAHFGQDAHNLWAAFLTPHLQRSINRFATK